MILLELLSASHSSFSTPRESDKLKRLGIFFLSFFFEVVAKQVERRRS